MLLLQRIGYYIEMFSLNPQTFFNYSSVYIYMLTNILLLYSSVTKLINLSNWNSNHILHFFEEEDCKERKWGHRIAQMLIRWGHHLITWSSLCEKFSHFSYQMNYISIFFLLKLHSIERKKISIEIKIIFLEVKGDMRGLE